MVVTWTAMLERMFDGAVSVEFDTSLDDLRVEYQHSRTTGTKRRDSCVSPMRWTASSRRLSSCA